MIRFFNTFSGKVEEFTPLMDQEVRMYTCGPTVYDYAHIGNFRAFVFEDLLRRFLEFRGFRVTHVMNITDVDDKTIAGANRHVGATHASPHERLQGFTEGYIQAFNEDLKTLNILPPSKQPRATAEIPAMIELIAKLIKKSAAYVSDGSVYYRVDTFKDYGKLSKKNLEKNIKGARVDVDAYEREEGFDFALWKKAKEGEPAWESPWGKGRPGWHIECSAMSMKYLGESFDIHAGGEDLIFPHHENEIAQSQGATGKKFVRYWLHCKHLLVNGEKMSKSKGNYYTLRDLLNRGYSPRAIRYVLLSVHYRQPLNFTLDSVQAAENTLRDLAQFYSSVLNYDLWGRKYAAEDKLKARIQELKDAIVRVLENDLEISEALARLFSFVGETDVLIREGNISRNDRDALLSVFDLIDRVFGVVPDERYEKFDEEVKALRNKREKLRQEKRFQEADECRKKLHELGYLVWDESSGVSGIARI